MGHATTPPNLPTPLHPVTAFQKRISVGLPVRGGRGASAGFAVPHLSCPSFLIAGPGHAHPLPFYFFPPLKKVQQLSIGKIGSGTTGDLRLLPAAWCSLHPGWSCLAPKLVPIHLAFISKLSSSALQPWSGLKFQRLFQMMQPSVVTWKAPQFPSRLGKSECL